MKHVYLNLRTLLAIFHDSIAILIAWLFAYTIRFNFYIPLDHLSSMWLSILWIVPLQMVFFISFGLLYFSVIVFAITGFKTTGLSNFQKLISILSLPLYYIITYFLYIRQLSAEDFKYYFEKLGGYG